MTYWLESLTQGGFDVFTVVYMAILFTLYHYLMRWYQDTRFKKIENKLDVINQTVNEALDEVLP